MYTWFILKVNPHECLVGDFNEIIGSSEHSRSKDYLIN